ncbi:MAG TPA: sulfite exporter TauE/SafE family protein [Candidatus Acidoferrum sp.]|nr:sulfite exporter TauE/SafE family protein [Candidatus Acidoferrum sp.]
MDVGPLLVGLTCAAALVTGFLRNAVGGGIGLALTPLLTLVLPPQPVLAMIGLLLLLSDPISLWLYWRRWDGGEVRRLVPAMLVGIVLGGWLVAGLSATSLRQAIGGAALLFGSVQLAVMLRGGTPTAAPSSPPVAMGVGLTAGVASTVAHSGGVVLGLYLVGRPLTSAGIVATGTLAYAISDVVKVGTYAAIGWVTPPLLLATVAATPLLYLGSWLGYRLNARLPRRAFALTLVAIALTGALRLLLS